MKDERPLRLIDALRVGLIHEIDGLTLTPDPEWPARMAAAAKSGVIFGLPNHLFSESYLAACHAAPPNGPLSGKPDVGPTSPNDRV
jgi:hypothetical protein